MVAGFSHLCTETDRFSKPSLQGPLRLTSVVFQVLLMVETDTDDASDQEEEEEEPAEVGEGHVQFSGGPVRPSWVLV